MEEEPKRLQYPATKMPQNLNEEYHQSVDWISLGLKDLPMDMKGTCAPGQAFGRNQADCIHRANDLLRTPSRMDQMENCNLLLAWTEEVCFQCKVGFFWAD